MIDTPNHAIVSSRACALCGGELAPDTQVCKRCGASASRVGQCSQCQSLSSIEPSKDLYWKCSVCGSARLMPTKLESNAAVQLGLREATRAHRLSKLASPLAFAASAVFLLGFILAFIIKGLVQPGDAAAGAIFAFPALMLLLSVFGFWKTAKLRRQRDDHLKEAYKQAILYLITSMGVSSTPTDIAKTFGIEASRSERLLAELNVRDDISSEVTEDGQIVYSSAAMSGPSSPMTQPLTERLRVPEESNPTPGNSVPDQVHEPDIKTMLSSVETPDPKLRSK